jgi:lipopolysaccharide transport system permease protein
MILYSKKHQNLFKELVISQYKLKDQSKFFGFIWSFMNPLLMLAVLLTFFSLLLKNSIENYVIFILIGLVHYTHFSNSTSASMRILENMRQLTSEAVFPKELLVISSIVTNVFEFAISLVITVAIAYGTGVQFSASVFLLPFVFILQLMLVTWISFFLSCFYLYVKDIDHIYQVLLRMLFFMTPIFYDASHLGEVAKMILTLNPLTHLIYFSRTIIIEGKPFSFETWGIMFLVNSVLIYLSFTLFKKFEPTFAENL